MGRHGAPKEVWEIRAQMVKDFGKEEADKIFERAVKKALEKGPLN